MKLQVIKVGKPAFLEIKKLVEMYETRTSAFTKIESLLLKDADQLEKFLKKTAWGTDQILVTLDERGRQLRSNALADNLRGWSDDPRVKSVCFVIGGPFGLPDKLRDKADLLWSLSDSTLQGDLAWLVCWEQIYRAYNILKGTGYHHD